jgi:hypothetical protein
MNHKEIQASPGGLRYANDPSLGKISEIDRENPLHRKLPAFKILAMPLEIERKHQLEKRSFKYIQNEFHICMNFKRDEIYYMVNLGSIYFL